MVMRQMINNGPFNLINTQVELFIIIFMLLHIIYVFSTVMYDIFFKFQNKCEILILVIDGLQIFI